MSIQLLLGPMFAGKTSELLRLGRRHELAGRKVLYVKHLMDVRYMDGCYLHTHDGVKRDAIACRRLGDIEEEFHNNGGKDVVCIDEGQFFEDLEQICLELASIHQKHVIVAALNATFRQRLFSSVAKLIPLVDDVQWLKAVCFRCGSNEAAFTRRLVEDGEYWDEQLNFRPYPVCFFLIFIFFFCILKFSGQS